MQGASCALSEEEQIVSQAGGMFQGPSPCSTAWEEPTFLERAAQQKLCIAQNPLCTTDGRRVRADSRICASPSFVLGQGHPCLRLCCSPCNAASPPAPWEESLCFHGISSRALGPGDAQRGMPGWDITVHFRAPATHCFPGEHRQDTPISKNTFTAAKRCNMFP